MSDHKHSRSGDVTDEAKIISAIKNGTGALVTRLMVGVCLPIIVFFLGRLVVQIDNMDERLALVETAVAGARTDIGWLKRSLPGNITLDFPP